MYTRATRFVLSNSEGSRRVLILGNERYLEGCLGFTFSENVRKCLVFVWGVGLAWGKKKLQFIFGNYIPRNMIPSLFSPKGLVFLATLRRNCWFQCDC